MTLPPRRAALAAMAVRRGLKQLADALVPPEVAVNDLCTATGITQVAHTFAELGIADVIGDRAYTSAQIAAQLGTDADLTHRLLRSASGSGLCRMNRTGTITLTRSGRVLRADHPRSLRAWVMLHGSRMQTEAWTGLSDALRTGASPFVTVHGVHLWDWLATHPADALVFDEAMRRGTTINADGIAAAYPWPSHGVICDVGGGVGTLLSEIITSCGGLRGVLVESPDVSARARTFLEARGLTERVDVVVGDMFGTVPATADVYLLKDVLHDWDDEHCSKILSTVAATMPRGSRIVLVEVLQQPNTPNPLAPWADLLMLTQTDGGRQRSADELAALLTDAGLCPTGTVRHAIPHGLVEAVKP